MPWREAEESILACTAQIMQQAIDLLRANHISPSHFTFESQIMPGSSPGKHFRHVLDHLRILLDAIESWQAQAQASSSRLIVDYDSRVMNKLPQLDTCPQVSLREFQSTNDRLYRLFDQSNGHLYGQAVLLRATTPFVVDMESTIGRELWFCGLHAIHHYALARVILVKELALTKIDTQFGVAPSTLVHRHWKQQSDQNESHQHKDPSPRARL